MWSLVDALGFRAQRVIATIVFAPDLPPSHGTTVVELDGERVDVGLVEQRREGRGGHARRGVAGRDDGSPVALSLLVQRGKWVPMPVTR